LVPFVIDKTPPTATVGANPFALIGAIVRPVQNLLRPARSAAKVAIGAARDLTRTRSELLAENALLRQQVIVLRRGTRRPRIHRDDRLLLLIQAMAKDNALWGAERIRGEFLKLGIRVSKRTFQKYMGHVRPSGSRGQTWRTFIRNHGSDIWACDFLQRCDLFFRPLFAFFLVVQGTRAIVLFNVTR
jgi:hypothetical protein